MAAAYYRRPDANGTGGLAKRIWREAPRGPSLDTVNVHGARLIQEAHLIRPAFPPGVRQQKKYNALGVFARSPEAPLHRLHRCHAGGCRRPVG